MSLYRRNIINVCKNTSILPAEYQLVEYLQSSGTQYISVPITAGFVSKIYAEYTSVASGTTTVCGTWVNSSGWGVCVQQTSNTAMRYWFNNGGIKTVSSALGSHIFESENGGEFYLDSVSLGSYVQGTTSVIDKIALFAYYRMDNNTYYPTTMRIQHFALSMGSDIDLYPCYRKADGVAGMYDIVNNVFYTNAGTGTFIVGADIN